MKFTSRDKMSIQVLDIDGATYEQRWIKCGKKNCWCAEPAASRYGKPPGHGPYWYRLINKPKMQKADGTSEPPRLIRRYIGANLITGPKPKKGGKADADKPKSDERSLDGQGPHAQL